MNLSFPISKAAIKVRGYTLKSRPYSDYSNNFPQINAIMRAYFSENFLKHRYYGHRFSIKP